MAALAERSTRLGELDCLTPQEKLHRFEDQISPHLRSAYNLASWLTRNREDAEDVVQEAFLRAFAALESFRGDDGKAWLLTIVRNTCMTWLKRNRNAAVMSSFEQDEDPTELSPDPEEILLISCDREQVREALERLPSDFREAILLREFESLSYKEIATIVSVPVGTVMSRLSRGREYLRRILSSPRKELARDEM